MLKQDTFLRGLILGFVVPALGFALFYGFFQLLDVFADTLRQGLRPEFRLRTSALIGIALNALLMNRFHKRNETDSMRGLTVPTTLYVVGWLLLFGKTIL